QQADLLLALGTRLAIPQVGYDRNDFAREAERWVVDVDPTELSKFDSLAWNLIQADAGTAIRALHARERSAERLSDLEPWISRLGELSREFPRSQQIGSPAPDGFIHSFDFVQELCGLSTDSTIVVTDVGAGLLTGHYGWSVKQGQRIFTSQGLGEMGFGLPGAIGAQVSSPEQTVICLNTDGGIMFNLQEMQLVKTYELPIKLVIFNNMGYTMIRSSQDNLFHGRRNGSDVGQDIGFPRFSEIAAVFAMRHTLVDSVEVARAKLPDVLSSAQAELIEVKMSADQLYLPRLATGKNTDGSFSSPPIEDLTPRLNADFLARWLGKEPVADE
ncbi:thiamine pyrophosphate-dependent enzyme, partial [Pontimonas sp.]